MIDKAFKTCRLCETSWPTLADFVKDRKLRVNGYQASFGAPEDGVILLTHDVPGCGTTLGLVAGTLQNLYHGPRYVEVLAGTRPCELWCLDEHSIEDCDAPCAMAWIRHVLQYLRRHELPEHLRKEQS
ncbi:MAG: hypothetical protein ABFD96_23640 [Armatimonadia bacterium]